MSDLTLKDFVRDVFVKSVDSIEHSVVGDLVSYECPNCHKTQHIKDYEGNVVEGLTCPACHCRIEPIEEEEEESSANLEKK
ncbi:hypothetical protein C9374_007995 [Naegleria lovaniensis]|uniref:Uncharacterized protein n=1 Tax=Naegleria lovaniensis TaxID=51637 RepID=A0AA88GG52_NAELO|nr:uncharacterized protein C9374_007995 [Naegleria lovaniensis]KAG2378847.1 hypothetical protein C9374_007995 [Naegleria lovaniensis]